MLPWSLSEYFDKWNKATCLLLLIAFSSLSDIITTLKIGITITWSFTLRYVIAATLWCWKKISYNDVTSISKRNRSISRCKSNKKPMSLQYGVPTAIPTKCARFISRHFLDMMRGRLNCQTVATSLIIAHRSLLFDKFRVVSSFYKNSMVF